MVRRVLAPLLLLLLQGLFAAESRGIAEEWTIVDVKAQAAGPPPHLELPFFHRKTLSEDSKTGGVAAQNLIAFGYRARRGQFPYVASLLKSSSSGAGFYHSCTATLIAPNLLLTAAHCFFNLTTGAWSPPTQVLLGGIDLSSSSNFRESITPTVRTKKNSTERQCNRLAPSIATCLLYSPLRLMCYVVLSRLVKLLLITLLSCFAAISMIVPQQYTSDCLQISSESTTESWLFYCCFNAVFAVIADIINILIDWHVNSNRTVTTPELALQNTVLVKGVLDYHLIPDDVIYTKDLEQIQSWGTNLGNQLLTIVKAGKAKVRIYYGAMKFDGTTDLKFGGYAQITVPNVKADKSVVQVINRVLIPALPQA